jgi:hypothetical protein
MVIVEERVTKMESLKLWSAWAVDRVKERTSLDGMVILAVSGMVLLASPLLKLAAWLGVIYGIWSIVKEED